MFLHSFVHDFIDLPVHPSDHLNTTEQARQIFCTLGFSAVTGGGGGGGVGRLGGVIFSASLGASFTAVCTAA